MHRLFAAPISLYSGKARAYLRYKGIEYEEVLATREVIEQIVHPRTGLRMIPVLITDDDVAVQDTSAIIDHLEARYPEASVYPTTPRQRVVSLLLELYGDEWLLMPAMHYRWHYKRANMGLVLREFGQLVAPRLPRALWPLAGLPMALYFGAGHKPVLGLGRRNRAAVEASYEAFLAAFDAHLREHDFLLGSRPSIGDFGFMGPLYAHLYRDPHPGRLMRRVAPRVARWVERMNDPEVRGGEFLADDEIPETLLPILRMVFGAHFPVLADTVKHVDRWVRAHPERDPISRFVGRHRFTIGGVENTRAVQSFTQWMLQRPLDAYTDLDAAARASVDELLRRVGGHEAMQIEIVTRVERGADNRLHAQRG